MSGFTTSLDRGCRATSSRLLGARLGIPAGAGIRSIWCWPHSSKASAIHW